MDDDFAEFIPLKFLKLFHGLREVAANDRCDRKGHEVLETVSES